MKTSVASILSRTAKRIRRAGKTEEFSSKEELPETVKGDLSHMKIKDKHIVELFKDSLGYNIALDKKINIVFSKNDLNRLEYLSVSDNRITLTI